MQIRFSMNFLRGTGTPISSKLSIRMLGSNASAIKKNCNCGGVIQKAGPDRNGKRNTWSKRLKAELRLRKNGPEFDKPSQ